MKIEFTSLDSEPLVYFLLHSGAFVLAMGGVFFVLGIAFGGAIWGRYKKQSNLLRAEITSQREEIATLKRKLAEQVVRPVSMPLPSAPPALLTEVLPSVSDVFPERLKMLTTPSEKTLPAAPVVPPSLPETPVLPSVITKPSLISNGVHAPVAPLTPPRPVVTPIKVADEAAPLPTVAPTETSFLEPFSFLLPDLDAGEEDSVASISALSAIISAAPMAAPLPIPALPSVIPEMDPILGQIYKETPLDADELTQIQGITPALQKRLHELGVFKFSQISAWTSSQVQHFSSLFAFKDRIQRERWVEQAQEKNKG